MTQYVYGKNVVKQLLSEHKKIYEIIMAEGSVDHVFANEIKKANVPIKSMSKKKMDQLLQGNHQGIAAKIEDYKTYEIDEIIATIPPHKTPLFVMLDGLEDPHNLGAILRTCDAVGVDGVIIGKHRNVGLTPTVAKVSTGAIDTVKVAMVTNLVQTIKYLKTKRYWIAGADFDNSCDYREATYDMPLVLVVGSEGFGISSLVKKNCDFCVRLPMEGSISSLNASVACAVLLYQIHSKRHPL